MKKNKTVILLVLIAILPHPLFSNEERCEETIEFDMGLLDARNQKARLLRSIGWGVLSAQVIGLFAEAGTIAGWVLLYDPDGWLGLSSHTAIGLVGGFFVGAGIGTAVSIAIPATIISRPKVIPDHISEDNEECYLEGYATGTRRNRVRGAVVGCAVTWAFMLGYYIVEGPL